MARPHWPGPDHRVHLMISGGADSMALSCAIADFQRLDSVKCYSSDHSVAAKAGIALI